MKLPSFATHPRALLAELNSAFAPGAAQAADWTAAERTVRSATGELKVLEKLDGSPEMKRLVETMNSAAVAVYTRYAPGVHAETGRAIAQFDALEGALALRLHANASRPVTQAARADGSIAPFSASPWKHAGRSGDDVWVGMGNGFGNPVRLTRT